MHAYSSSELLLAASLIPGLSAKTTTQALLQANFDPERAALTLKKAARARWREAFEGEALAQAMGAEQAALRAHDAWCIDPTAANWVPSAPLGVLRGRGTPPPYRGIAIVGARRADGYGRQLAARIARTVVQSGRVVVSGGAFGIDIEAHRAALQEGGDTVVVLGSGLAHPSPATHKSIFEEAAERGAVVSPFKCDQGAARWTFPRRNPWIVALSEVVVVVQAAIRSGALQTARVALKMGTPVFVAPGPLDSPLHAGCHQLVEEGAALLTAVDGWLRGCDDVPLRLPGLQPSPAGPEVPRDGRSLWDVTGIEPRPLADLAAAAGLDVGAAALVALGLELEGWLTSAPGGRYARGR